MPGPYVDPNAPLQRLGGAIADAFTAPIQPAAPGAMGALTMPGGAPPAPAAPASDAGFTPVPVINPAAKPELQPAADAPWGPAPMPPGPQAAPAEQPWGPAPMPAGPALIPSTSTDVTTQTSGPDKATTENINAATAEANTAAQAAGTAKVDELNATAGFERSEAQAQYGRGVNAYFERAGEMQTQDQIIRETQTALEETAKFKPDRTALFHGDNGTLFGISAAVAAMAGGWLMGQGLTGGKNPYLETVMRMIDENANDQIQANSQVYQELTRRLGTAEAAKRELKARMYEAVNTTIEAQSRFNKAELVQKGAAGVMAEVQKEAARNRLEAAKLTGQTKTKTVQSRTQMVANPAASFGLDLTDPKIYAQVGSVQAFDNLQKEVEGLAKSGVLAENVGFLDEKWNWVKDKFNARDPGAAQIQRVKDVYETVTRRNWPNEPANDAARRLAAIGWPQNDAEVPLFLDTMRRAVQAVDPGGRYRAASRAMGNQTETPETRKIPVVK